MRSRDRRLLAAAALTITASLAVVGCGSDAPTGTPDSSQTTTAGSSPAALAQALSPEETEAADPTAGPTDSAPKSEEPDATTGRAELVVSEIRMGDFRGRDRVVFELDGRGTPSYSVDYVSAPAQQGSGFPVEVSGDSFLQVMIGGQILPTETDMEEVPVGTVTGDDATGVAGVAFTGQFEGQAQAVIGLEGADRPFSAFLLQNPTRLVVDVQR